MRTMSEPRVSSSRRSSEKSCTIALSTCSNSSSLSSEMRESTSRFISTTSSASSLSVWSSAGSSSAMKRFISVGAFSSSMLIQRSAAMRVGMWCELSSVVSVRSSGLSSNSSVVSRTRMMRSELVTPATWRISSSASEMQCMIAPSSSE